MYLRKLRVQNVKLLRDVTIDFARADGSPRMWTVFVGENRSCKTTLLQTIAAAASGREQAIHLTTDVIASWPDLRRPDATLHIDATFGFSERRHRDRRYPDYAGAGMAPGLQVQLELAPGSTVLDGTSYFVTGDGPDDVAATEWHRLDPLVAARRSNLPDWFVAGYGVRRTLRGAGMVDAQRQRDPARDRLTPLFGEDLIGTGYIELLTPELGRAFAKILQQVFVAGGLLPHITALELRGRGGIRTAKNLIEAQRFEMDIRGEDGEPMRVPATWLSQGYQSIIAWIADLVGQILLEAGAAVDAAEMEGCVLLDEIDMFLHPTWQLRLVPALKRVFPRLQFIVTTHSPMVLPALTAEDVILLSHDADGSVVATPAERSPALLTGTELFGEFFSIDRLYPSELGEKLRRYGRLAADPTRSDEEDADMRTLRRELAAAGVEPAWEPAPREATG